MIVVSDNSVLSCLAEMGELDLLRRLYGKVTITETIWREAVHAGAPENLRNLLLKIPEWILVVPDETPYLEETGALDAGEASAITLAWQHRDSSLLILERFSEVFRNTALRCYQSWLSEEVAESGEDSCF